MLRASSGCTVERPEWKPTTAFRSAPPRASSRDSQRHGPDSQRASAAALRAERSGHRRCRRGRTVDAVFLAIENLTGISVVCKDFNVHSVTVGKDAQGEVMVQVEHGGRMYRGRGVSTDSVEASARAFLNAVNKIAAVTV